MRYIHRYHARHEFKISFVRKVLRVYNREKVQKSLSDIWINIYSWADKKGGLAAFLNICDLNSIIREIKVFGIDFPRRSTACFQENFLFTSKCNWFAIDFNEINYLLSIFTNATSDACRHQICTTCDLCIEPAQLALALTSSTLGHKRIIGSKAANLCCRSLNYAKFVCSFLNRPHRSVDNNYFISMRYWCAFVLTAASFFRTHIINSV